MGADVERVEQVMKVRRREDGKGSVFDFFLSFSVKGTSSGGGGDGARRCPLLPLQCAAS